jgi:membrane protease YdiL (CAAX protease family)
MNPLIERIRRLPPGVEFLVVVTWAFGLTIFSSILAMGIGPDAVAQTNQALVGGLMQMIAITIVLGWFLKARGWTLEKLGLALTAGGTRWGVMLLAVSLLLYFVVQFVALYSFEINIETATDRFPALESASPAYVFLAAVVSAVFEELFVAGYVITALSATRGPWTAVNVSTGLRVLYHLHQGPLGVLTIVPLGLLFGWVYVRTRQLWPLIAAHVLLDVVWLAVLLGSDPLS